jgi:hypothetical protein
MTKETLYYDNAFKIVWSNDGKEYKEYDIKTEKGRSWRFVYHNNTKVGVESLPKRTRIRHFDDVEANYIFNWRTQYPCTAIAYLINRRNKAAINRERNFKQKNKNR